ncbi:DUF4350 domain-containing protein [Micromonospora sp. NPDC093277]|uniref:DUF4350 domain-containing protein n=1 Tax=Micromonospora sp. NPDC093277 TaxID=3364291 RepID=UPI0038253B86
MTATLDPPRPVAPARTRRRRHQLLIPFGLAVLLIVATLVFHAVDQPDATDRDFVSPAATGDDGGSKLAEALREQGVTVRRETDTWQALRAAQAGPTTLFVPAPDLVPSNLVAGLADLPPGSRLVLVDPSRWVLARLDVPLTPTDRRWATRATVPDADGSRCPLAEADRAGTAAADRQRYEARGSTAIDRCYSGGLVRLRWSAEVVVIGASDPFRNDRIDEWGNRALATGLLGGDRRLVWLDLPGRAAAPDGPGWEPGNGGDGPQNRPSPRPRKQAERPQHQENPLWGAFPTWFWALLVQLALAGLLLMLWRARRLGPPVPEPLPVTVPSAETVLGRARLYRRAGAREHAADTLRAAALARLRPRLNLPPDTPPAEVAARVAEYAGEDVERVGELLHGGAPTTDQELLELARDLDVLTRTLVHPTEGDPR